MKRRISIILIFTLLSATLFTFTGCKDVEEEDLSTKIEEKLTVYRTDLEDSASTLTTPSAVRDYLANWAKSKGIDYTIDNSDNVIMSVKPSKAYKDAPPAVIVCSYDASQFKQCIQPMAMAMYLAKNNENTGKLTVIFAKEDNHDFSGVRKLNNKYFTKNSRVFCLNSGSKNMWSIRTSARSSYEFTNNIEFTKPEGTKAFKIRIKGLPGGIPDAKVNDYPNPIKELGSLLAYFKTNALIYELAKVNGGSSANVYPKSASATVVINEDDFSKFESRMDKAIETFNKKYLKKYPDMTYTYEEVSLPEKVMTRDTLNDFIIVLYTLLNGVYQSDEATGLSSITSVGSIKCKDDTCVISAVGNSLSQTSMDEIDTTYYTTCGLSDINYQKTDSQRNWFGNVENPFYKDISDAFRKYSGGEMEFKDCISATNTSYVYKKNNKAGIVNISVNENKAERYTGTILTYLMNLPHTSDEN